MPEFKNKEEYEKWKAERAKARNITQTEALQETEPKNSQQAPQPKQNRMVKASIIITCGLITLTLCYFFVYPKYKEREIQADFKTIAQQRLENLKSWSAFPLFKRCKKRESTWRETDIYDSSIIVEYSDNYFIEVRKTDSLTSPYMAVARYPYKLGQSNGLSEKDCLESLPIIIKEETLIKTFAYQNDKWEETTKQEGQP